MKAAPQTAELRAVQDGAVSGGVASSSRRRRKRRSCVRERLPRFARNDGLGNAVSGGDASSSRRRRKRRSCEQDEEPQRSLQVVNDCAATKYCDANTPFAAYSVRRATTGSFFAAAPAGIKPLIKVKPTLMAIIMSAELNGRDAKVEMPVNEPKRALIPKESR